MLVAARAGTAARKADDDRVAHAQPFDAFADRLDHPGAFMAEDARQRERCELRSEEHTSELQSLMRISYAVFCLKKKKNKQTIYIQILTLHITCNEIRDPE